MTGSNATVLVVDDDPSLRTLSRVLLELEGFSVREAASLEEAESALAEERPAVVLLDVHLCSAASDPLFDRLRADGIPVAAVTGSADTSSYADRADATLMKPFEPAALVDLARRLAGSVASPSTTASVLSPSEFSERLRQYLIERSEEGRAVRVGEKEVSEQAEIVRRYAELFSREQLEALRAREEAAEGDERELLYRLRKTCEGGLVAAELAEQEDELENRLLAARVAFRGEELPLRTAQARLAVLPEYDAREEL